MMAEAGMGLVAAMDVDIRMDPEAARLEHHMDPVFRIVRCQDFGSM